MVRSFVFISAVAEAADDFGMLQATKLAEEQSTMLKTESADKSLSSLSRVQDPRRASQLLQEFALNTLETGSGIDEDTKKQLIAIRDILTNETYMQLEQSHRYDQDLLIKHANAINECGAIHLRHLQQDIEGQEVQLVRDLEQALYDCRGIGGGNYVACPHLDDVKKHAVGLLQTQGDVDASECDECEVNEEKGCTPRWEDCAVDEWANYDPAKDPDGYFALQAVRAHPNDKQILKGIWNHENGWKAGGSHRYFAQWTAANDPRYQEPDWLGTHSCAALHCSMFEACDALHDFVASLPKPDCNPPIGDHVMEVPTCDAGKIIGVDSDLEDWFTNMQTNARFYQGTWRKLRHACQTIRDEFDVRCKECTQKQHMLEQAFCTYRQGLHSTCREYQGCHVLNEKQFNDLVKQVMYNADSRKIDWKAIHKIECYINVLISSEVNVIRAKQLLNCEAGNLNTIETILTGFNETNYLRIIEPSINQSCWDLEVPSYIDFKECDMTSCEQYPGTDGWQNKYNGHHCVGETTPCAPIPEADMYNPDDQHRRLNHQGYVDKRFGGGWYFVNEVGRSNEDINDLTDLAPGGYHLPKYVTSGLRWNEVLVERLSHNWCDSFDRQSSYWVEDGGASMCVQSDDEHVYCTNNANDADDKPITGINNRFRQQPVSHFRKLCNNGTEAVEGRPACDCWPATDRQCWSMKNVHDDNKPAPRNVRIQALGTNGSVVKISFQGEEKFQQTLRVGNMEAFIGDGAGCNAIGAVRYRVFVRCLGCTTEDKEFHTVAGVEFSGGSYKFGREDVKQRKEYTYEAWFKLPKNSDRRQREIFGGEDGLMLVNSNAVPCVSRGSSHGPTEGYQVHAGGTDKYGSVCFSPQTWYHVAVTKDKEGKVNVYVNSRDVTATGDQDTNKDVNVLSSSFARGFTDGGQLFNVRIWDHARTHQMLINDAFANTLDHMSDVAGLAHWYPLTEDIKDLITGLPLTGDSMTRDSPIWCSDLEAGGMLGC